MKIAILGTENSHAWAFADLIHKNDIYKDIEIIGIYGYDDAANKKIVDAGYCNYVASDPHEFLGKVDAIMCTARHGDNHYAYAIPYVKAGIPCFIDKPFTVDMAKAEEMITEAKKSGALLCGGSMLKYMDGLKEMREFIDEKGAVMGGDISAPINMVNDHGGFFFYSQHLIEMMLTVFGEDVKKIYARCPDESKNRLTFIADYGDFDVTGHFYGCYHYACNLYSAEGIKHSECVAGHYDLAKHYKNEFDEFIAMVNNKKMPESYERLILPVKILNAIYDSYKTGKEVVIK